MTHETLAAYLGLLVSIIALFLSIVSYRGSNKLQRSMFKKDKVIELATAWRGVNSIDPANLIMPDVVNSVNALDLTASLWNHDIVEKEILMQSYWAPFRDLYDSLYGCTAMPPGGKKTCRDCITPDITRAYDEMRQHQLKQVRQTTT